MNKKLTVTLVFCFFYLFCASPCRATEQRALFFSYPSDGVDWALYNLANIAKSYNIHSPEYQPAISLEKVDSSTKEIYYFSSLDYLHKYLGPYDIENDSLLFMLRDFKECFAQRAQGNFDLMLDIAEGVNEVTNVEHRLSYFRDILLFHAWPHERKHLFYYEDLVLNEEETLLGIAEFLGEDLDYVRTFLLTRLQSSDELVKRYTNKKKVNPYSCRLSKNLSVKLIDKVINRVENRFVESTLFHQYLDVYLLDSN